MPPALLLVASWFSLFGFDFPNVSACAGLRASERCFSVHFVTKLRFPKGLRCEQKPIAASKCWKSFQNMVPTFNQLRIKSGSGPQGALSVVPMDSKGAQAAKMAPRGAKMEVPGLPNASLGNKNGR